MKTYSPIAQEMPLDIVGSSTFGRDPKILASRTFNMIIADDWFVDYGGYQKILTLAAGTTGRGIFSSVRGNRLIAVAANTVYSISVFVTSSNERVKVYKVTSVGTINSFFGDVFMDENNSNQIAICDQHHLYIYNYVTNTFQQAVLPTGVSPGYVTYQNGRFIVPDTTSASWYLSQVGDGLNWFWGASGEPVFAAIQTKPDFAKVTLRFPGRGNLLFVMGQTITELWTDVGAALFPYQRSTTLNFDYGCLNPATIATSDEIVAWIGSNEKSGPVLMYSTGSDVKQISTDGINYQLSQLEKPESCSAFFLKLSGHLIYQFTFYDPADNVSFIYDFTTQKFFDVTDQNMDHHIARRVAYFDDDYFFVDFNDGSIYQMDASFTTYNYIDQSSNQGGVYEIPKVRTCSNIRMPNSTRFIINKVTFTVEQGNDLKNQIGQTTYQPRIGCSISQNGGENFSSYVTNPIYKIGNRQNKLDWWNLGSANDFVAQFRFWGQGPWKAFNGTASIYQ
jgi:hypothetical protein